MDHGSPNPILVSLDRDGALSILGGKDPIKLHSRVGGTKLNSFLLCFDSRGPEFASMDCSLDFGKAVFNGINKGPPSLCSRVIRERHHLEVRFRANPWNELLSSSRDIQENTTKKRDW